jgi:sensor histidine kinase YesM
MQKYPFIFSDEKKYRIQRHVVFWTFWWLFQGFLYAFIPARTYHGKFFNFLDFLPISMLDSLLYMPAHIFLAYSLMYFVIPRFIIRGKYTVAGIWVFALFITAAFLSALTGRYILFPVRILLLPGTYILTYTSTSESFYLSILAGLRGGITIGGIAAAIKLMKFWYLKEQRNLQLQKENVASQLQLLKAQIHPHFLFNTLNNIYSYTQNTSPVAAKMVTGLSDLLRFMLYEGDQRVVPLFKELKMIQDYVGLEKIRYGNKLDIHIDIPANTNDLHIAPLLLLPLVENCFKHGTSNMLDQPWISLQITLYKNEMRMKLINGKSVVSPARQSTNGIGLLNVEKRLALIYPGKHELIVTSDADVFVVNLKVELEQVTDKTVKPATEQPLVYA